MYQFVLENYEKRRCSLGDKWRESSRVDKQKQAHLTQLNVRRKVELRSSRKLHMGLLLEEMAVYITVQRPQMSIRTQIKASTHPWVQNRDLSLQNTSNLYVNSLNTVKKVYYILIPKCTQPFTNVIYRGFLVGVYVNRHDRTFILCD